MLNVALKDRVFEQLSKMVESVEIIQEGETTLICGSLDSYNIHVCVSDGVTYEIEYEDIVYCRCRDLSQFVECLDLLKDKYKKQEPTKDYNVVSNLRKYLKTQDYIDWINNTAYINNLDHQRNAKIFFGDGVVKIYSLQRGTETYKDLRLAKAAIYSLHTLRNKGGFDDINAENFLNKAFSPFIKSTYRRGYDLYSLDGIFRTTIRFEEEEVLVGGIPYTSLAEFAKCIYDKAFN